MLVGCSEISISVVAKHVQYTGIIRGFFVCLGDLLSFSVPERTGQIAGLWFARGGSVPRLTLSTFPVFNKN